MKATGICAALLLAFGCGQVAEDEPTTGQRGIALLSETPDTISLIFASPEAKLHTDAILANEVTDFAYVKFDVSTQFETALHSADGLSIDMTEAAPIWFTHVYRGICDPPSIETRTCWLFERYQAGQDGLTGSAHLRLNGDIAETGYDVHWEGITDRFETPNLWHGHGSTGGYAVPFEKIR